MLKSVTTAAAPKVERKKIALLILLVLTAGVIYFSSSNSSEGSSGASAAHGSARASLEQTSAARSMPDLEALQPGRARPPAQGKAAARDFRPSMKHDPHNAIDTESFDPTLRTGVLDKLADVRTTPVKRSLFDFYTPPAPAASVEKLPEPVVPVVSAAAPPPRPEIQLHFYGHEIADGGGVQRVFCELNDQVMIPSEGTVLQHRYKIHRILAASVVVEDLQYHNEQTLPILKTDKPENTAQVR